MTTVAATAADFKPIERDTSSPEIEFLLAALRVATLRAKLAGCELDSIGIALRNSLVSYEGAVAWLNDLNLFDHVIYRPRHENTD